MKELSYKKQESTFLKPIFNVGYIELRALLNNKHLIYSQLLIPVLYFLFYSIGISSTFGNINYQNKEVSFLQFSFIGIVGLTVYSQMAQSVYRIILDRKWGLLAFKYFKGVSPISYLIGKMFFPVLSFVIQISVLYLISLLIGENFSFDKYLVISLFATVMMVFWFSLGTIIALRITSYKIRDLILNTLLVPISFTAPTFFSFDNSPYFIRMISYINPLTYQLGALRDISFEISNKTNIAVVLVMTSLAVIFAVYSIKTAELTSDER